MAEQLPFGSYFCPSDEQCSQLITYYIARHLTAGIYTTIPSVQDLTERQLFQIREAATLLLETAQIDLLWHLQERLYLVLERSMHDHVVNSRIEKMAHTIESLKVHASRLGNDPTLGTTVDQIQSTLPDLSMETTSLLANPPFLPFGWQDAHVIALVRWFKTTYMKWVDPIHCSRCSGPTALREIVQATEQEKADGGGRVELHECSKEGCGGQAKFVRYGRVSTLMRERRGRCGEFAHLFYAFMRASGLESRYVWNSEDHVWCEYWSTALGHWVHVDPSEGVTNKPLLYAKGWGKKQAYCLAVGSSGAEDVTRAYVDDWESGCQDRRGGSREEKELRTNLNLITVSVRLDITAEERNRLQAMDQLQARWINDETGRLAEAGEMEMSGRVSGSTEWRAMRGELGSKAVTKPKFSVLEAVDTPRSKMRLFGSADFTEQGVTLTSGPSQTGAIFYPQPVSQDTDFHFAMTFRLTSPPGAGEADGIAIVLAPEPKLGLGGYGLGYSGLGGDGDFAVEIDTYRTQDHADDPPTPHISVHSPPHAHHRQSIACTAPGDIPFLSDGRDFDLQLFYEGAPRKLRGYLTVPGEDEGEKTDVQICDIAIPARLPYEERKRWYLGVTGACGGLWQKQELLRWSLKRVSYVHGETESGMMNTEGLETA